MLKSHFWWQRIRERVRLAQGKASEEGAYSLRYRIPDDAPGKILVVVKEATGGTLAQPLESAQTAAAPDLTINLNAPSRGSLSIWNAVEQYHCRCCRI